MSFKNSFFTIIYCLILFSCNQFINENDKTQTNPFEAKTIIASTINVDIQIKYIDSIIQTDGVSIIENTSLTLWGGIKAYFYKNNLLYLSTRYNAELGYIGANYYINNDSIIKVVSHDKIAQWSEFRTKYPDLDAVSNENKMNYAIDTFSFIINDSKVVLDKENKQFNPLLQKNLIQSGYDLIMFVDTNLTKEFKTIHK